MSPSSRPKGTGATAAAKALQAVPSTSREGFRGLKGTSTTAAAKALGAVPTPAKEGWRGLKGTGTTANADALAGDGNPVAPAGDSTGALVNTSASASSGEGVVQQVRNCLACIVLDNLLTNNTFLVFSLQTIAAICCYQQTKVQR